MTCKKLTRQTLFRIVYGQEIFMHMEYIVPRLIIVAFTAMSDTGAVEDKLS